MSIDKAKGIISEPMPKEWYSKVSIYETDLSDEEKEFNASIVADKKPYFMRYIYPALKKQYDTYVENTNKKALRVFHMTVDELLEKEELSEEEAEFLSYYHKMLPVGTNDCVMNRICRRFEEEFDHYLSKHKDSAVIDPVILKSGEEYSLSQRRKIEALYKEYIACMKEYVIKARKERIDSDEVSDTRANMQRWFVSECSEVASNSKALCDLLVDVCYAKESTKYFLWLISGEQVIENLLERNGRRIMYPVADDDGDIVFGGSRFSIATKEIGGDYEYRPE